jgi:adenine-specific DNA-methyltransferase
MNLNLFNTTNLFEAATHLFKQLGITLNSNTTEPLPLKDVLKHYYKDNDTFKSVDKTYFIGIIDDSVFKVTGMFDKNYSYKEAIEQGEKNYNGLMLFALELNRQPTRTEISELTRAFNRISQKMPVALLLKYIVDKQAVFSIAISERFKYLQNWREGEKVGKIIMLRDIYTQNPHTGHIRILQDLVKPAGVNTYAQLHQHWLQVLDISILNKKFFQELSNWYFAVMDKVSFPDDVEKNKEIRNATNLIRLITRVIFIWFLKEKQLVPASMFRKDFVASILKDFNKNKKSHNYYNAILQNLFFGTLNQKIEERDFITEKSFQGKNPQYNVTTLYRYPELFNITKEEAKALFKDVPFLNGGLFDCLDKPKEDNDKEVIRVDGFTSNIEKRAIIPDYIFFGEEKEVDLNEVYGTKNKRYTFRGLINILESYKFTVAENTPLEEEIALDPELLGKVFENLLASYNPETQTTARKETGSFYTPREVVNYMVEESLFEYLKQNVKNTCENFETRLRELISYTETPNLFNREETQAIIEAISNCKILDPACGSGAFPMGILHTMVHILQKLDPQNQYWKELQRKKAIQETEQAFTIGDKEERAKRLAEINDVFENNASDYGRKLYLIENCIYGIDIQPIAIQIAKLRFFISLVIDQKVNKSKENFGIRSLPNLETKFVAANTLIGLDKPQQLAIRNPNIEQKEKELKQVRHEYFTANTRKKKIDLQKKDKQLRKKIAELLKDDKWDKKVAEQIASFDPYDQNHFANWFDPEWMFGIKEGFDIVIGNPPYVNVEEIDKNIKNNIKKFRTAYQKYDLYVLFYEKAIDLLKTNGQLCYITSNKFLSQGYGLLLRKEFLKYYIHQIINFNYDIFESATVRTCIFHLQKTNKLNSKVRIINVETSKDALKFENRHFSLLDQNIFNNTDQNNFRINLTYEKIKILNKIAAGSLKIEEIFSVNYGLRPIPINKSLTKDIFIKHQYKEGYKIYFEGKDMGRWIVNSSSYIDYRPEDMYNPMFPELFENEKLVGLCTLSDISKLRFVYDNSGAYVNHSVAILTLWHLLSNVQNSTILRSITAERIKNSERFDYYFVQGILNSNLIKFYVNELLYDGTHFYPNHIKSLPIKDVSLDKQKSIKEKVEQIHDKLKSDLNTDVSNLEKEINILVYRLYELTYEEVKVIDPAFALGREEYAKQ